jgi:hypothetical protein
MAFMRRFLGLGAVGCVAGYFAVKAASWPMPVGEVGDAVCSQVPFGTYFQALPW